jgi:hypothetical protein
MWSQLMLSIGEYNQKGQLIKMQFIKFLKN